MKHKALRFLQSGDSYPECHRFESYLSHYPEPKENQRVPGFSMPSQTGTKVAKKCLFGQLRYAEHMQNHMQIFGSNDIPAIIRSVM